MTHPARGDVALQRCDIFVGRTTNWLYDHLRCVPRFTPLVLCEQLANREEFPELQAHRFHWGLARRVWRRATGRRLFPGEIRWLRSLHPVVLHSHFGSAGVRDQRLAKALEVPWVVSFYGADVYEGAPAARRERYAGLFQDAARVLALGPAMASYLEKLGCPASKTVVHPLGVDVESLPFRPRILQPGARLRVLFAGTFREKKGIPYLVEAAALARRSGVPLELHLVGDEGGKPGDADTKAAVHRAIEALDLAQVVTRHSYLPFRDLLALALESHVFAAPSVTAGDGDAEGTPFVIQQMMATGMPVIATAHSDIPYLFGEHASLLVPERDAPAIARRLQRYAEKPDRLVTDGMALREQVQRHFDVRACASRLSALYEALRRS